MTRLLHLDLSLTSCVTLTKLFSLSLCFCVSVFSVMTRWAGEVSAQISFYLRRTWVLSRRLHGIIPVGPLSWAWVPYLGLGSPILGVGPRWLPFGPLLRDFFCFGPLFLCECALRAVLSSGVYVSHTYGMLHKSFVLLDGFS